MKKLNSIVITAVLLGAAAVSVLLLSCSGGSSGNEEPTSETGVINAGFENDKAEANSPKGWTVLGDKTVVSVKNGGYEGQYALSLVPSATCSTTVQQIVTGLTDGYYTLEFYAKSSGGQTSCYVSAGSSDSEMEMTSLQKSENTWVQTIVRGVKVEGGTCKIVIGIQSENGTWALIDNLKLTKTDKEYTLLKGGDISELSYVEQNGGRFFVNGWEKDCLEILKEKGFNIVRLRLYNDPGNLDYSPSKSLPKGIQNPDDILKLAKRAKAAGMKILLTFHYSDYWTNASTQNKPHEWSSLSYSDLKKAVYNFTYDFMNKMKAQGTTPEYVSLGNETRGGILFPDGSVAGNDFTKYAELNNEGYNAVKAVSSDCKVIVHLDKAGDKDIFDWFFGKLNSSGAKYDIIGASYYPYWNQITASAMREWANYESNKFSKNIFIMETGYNWNPTTATGYTGQLANNGPYESVYPSSKLGQKNYMLELFNEIKKSENGCINCCLYWDPVMIAAPNVGWIVGGPNVVSNTTLFDFQGLANDALDAFLYNN